MTKDNVKLYNRLIRIVGPKRVSISESERLAYSHDIAPLPKEVGLAFKTMPDAVVKPKNAHEISEIIKMACSENIPIVPRGAATWGFGGAVPAHGGIVLDISSMNKVLRVDEQNLEVEAEAGAVWIKVYNAALNKGLFIGSYPSSIYAATIAGWINTGGIGIGTYKYGSIGGNIRNMEVVLPEGQIINTGFNGVSDHSSGYNLNGLFVGSEGTLGVITKVTIKAYPAPKVLKPVSIQFPDLNGAFPFMKALSRNNITPLQISFVDERHVEFLRQSGKHTPGKGALINIALEGSTAAVRIEEQVIVKILTQTGGVKLPDKVAKHEWDERAYEFRPREIGLSAIPGEIVVPLTSFRETIKDIYLLIESMKLEAAIIGSLADRNTATLLPYFIYDEKKAIKSMTSLAFPKKLGDIAFRHGGRPLGFGMFFAPNLTKIRGKGAELMFDIKTILDPYDILNPGKLVETVTKQGIPIPGFVMDRGMDGMAMIKRSMTKDTAFRDRVEELKEEEGSA